MHSLSLRAALLGVCVCSATACTNSPAGTSLPFNNLPNNANGTSGTYQSGGTGSALVRFVNGTPDDPSVDFCLSSQPVFPSATAAYATALPLDTVASGIALTLAAYATPQFDAGGPGAECETSPGPYFGSSALAQSVVNLPTTTPADRVTIVLAGTAASNTLNFYYYQDPSVPTTAASISHNAAPAFTSTSGSVGFGTIATAGGAPAPLAGAQSIGAPSPAKITSAPLNASVTSTLDGTPASFYAGAGGAAVAPLVTIPAPAGVAGKAYVAELYAIDATGGGLNLIAISE